MSLRWACGISLVASVIALGMASPAHAADDGQLWTNVTATVKLSPKWRVSEDLTARFSDHRNGLYEIESNTLIGYSLAKGVTVWAGYTHDPNYSSGHFTVMEQRAREQVTFDNFARLGPGSLSGRIRTEQRWREGIDGTGWRVRPFIKYALPFRKGGHTAFVISTEPFFDLNTTAFQRTRGLDRVRTFVGLSTPLTTKVTADLGYLNQHVFVPHGHDNDDHVASVSLGISL